MGNVFKARRGDSDGLYLSNGGTDVFFDVLTLAGCALAATNWQRHLVLKYSDCHRYVMGVSGFNLDGLPWTADWPAEHAFVAEVVALAGRRHDWEKLRYDPPFAERYLRDYAGILAGFTPRPDPATADDWLAEPDPGFLLRCPTHDLYEGLYGCRLCDTWMQPQE